MERVPPESRYGAIPNQSEMERCPVNPGICLSDVSRGAGHGCQVQGTGVEYSKSSLIHRAKTGGGGKEVRSRQPFHKPSLSFSNCMQSEI